MMHLTISEAIIVFNAFSTLRLANSASFEWNDFLNLFSDCRLQICNYQRLNLAVVTAPVEVYSTLPQERRSEIPGRLSSLPCLALIHIFADVQNGKLPYLPRFRIKTYQTIDRRPLEKRDYDSNRYDALIYQKQEENGTKRLLNWWKDYYTALCVDGKRPSSALMVTMPFPDTLRIDDTLQVVNKFQASLQNLETQPWKLLASQLTRRNLDNAIQQVNSLDSNLQVPWNFQDLEFGQNIQEQVNDGILTLSSAHSLLSSSNEYEENRENYVIALTALGNRINISAETDPSIRFDVEGGEIMSSVLTFAWITCSPKIGGRVRYWRFCDVVSAFLHRFDTRTRFFIVMTYFIIPLSFGMLYHYLLKPDIQKKYHLNWHPFTWALRNLIRQPGDRILHSQRFGWSIWLVGPLLLVSVILTHSFLGQNPMLYRNLEQIDTREWFPVWTPYATGLELITDLVDLVKYFPVIPPPNYGNYSDILELLSGNRSIALVTWKHRVEILDKVGGCFRGNLKKGNAYVSSDKPDKRVGWEINGWGDHRIIQRVRRLEAESSIVGKWREMVNRRKPKIKRMRWISLISLRRSLLYYVFITGLVGLAVAFVAWVVEQITFSTCVGPQRRKEEMIKKERESRLREQEQKEFERLLALMQLQEETNPSAPPVESEERLNTGSMDEHLMEEAVALAEKEIDRRNSILERRESQGRKELKSAATKSVCSVVVSERREDRPSTSFREKTVADGTVTVSPSDLEVIDEEENARQEVEVEVYPGSSDSEEEQGHYYNNKGDMTLIDLEHISEYALGEKEDCQETIEEPKIESEDNGDDENVMSFEDTLQLLGNLPFRIESSETALNSEI